MGKGSRSERELFQKLWRSGFAVIRSPALGSGRKHPQPDLLASDGNRTVGIEVKSTTDDSIYVPKEEVEKLKEFCGKFGCDPLLDVSFDRRGWTLCRPGDCLTTKNNYKITRRTVGLILSTGQGFLKQETLSSNQTTR